MTINKISFKNLNTRREDISTGFFMPPVSVRPKRIIVIACRGQYFLWRDDENIFIKKSR